MLSDRLIRIVLAALVATWSPAWCCCRIASAEPPPPEPVVDVHSAEHGHRHAIGSECGDDHHVHHDSGSDDQPCPGHGPCSDHGSEEDCGCKNHQRQAELAKTAEVLQLKASGWIDWHAPAPLLLWIDPATAAHLHRLRTCQEASIGISRAQSLFASRCLLLI